ncbi:putative ferric-chelate reductase 1 homolog [Macrosteles quadrilineatus]|nr:putative ferric-chelate reductase 1 homolog [Macrosteles quadrilineatus]
MVQTRNESNIPVGKFRPANDVKLISCFGVEKNTAININYLPKEEVIIRWFPEEKDQGHTVRVVATIARDYLEKEYWLKHESVPIKILPPKYPLFVDR